MLTGAVVAASMEVCGWRLAAANAGPVIGYTSVPICTSDIWDSFAFRDYVEEAIGDLIKALPPDQRFRVSWKIDPDKTRNPHGSVGYFEALPVDADVTPSPETSPSDIDRFFIKESERITARINR